ncbi:uncharacterized protein LOC106667708 [Cimex lectularius]|uniref:Uncharacterized protein n=1 Tax=Cimex lectularius TaxID=79782 RepID=A0A8I6TI75_CIMLE|nr:uncharacterized protein LOC106667708 [Cimex lectularius]
MNPPGLSCPHTSKTSSMNILRDDSNYETDYTTTTKEHFGPPVFPNVPRARRREILRDFFMREVAEQVFNEVEKEEESSMAACKSDYKDEYTVEGFVIKNPLDMVDTEMFVKYPLYSDMAQTIYWSRLDRIKGKAVSSNPMAAFRKTSHFAKQWYDELE